MTDPLFLAIGNPDHFTHTGIVDVCDYDSYCPCGVRIKYRYHIVHDGNGTEHWIGSKCATRVGIYVGKLCLTCGGPNKMKTKHCGECRIKCLFHKKYHDDNIIHTKQNMKFEYGAHKGKTPDELLGQFDHYLIWICNQPEWTNASQRQYIIDSLLGKCCQPMFKTHATKTLAWIKKNEPKYFEYMRSSDRGCYLDLV